MIQGRFIKGGEVTEIVTNGMKEIEVPEKQLQHFNFPKREIKTHERIEGLSWNSIGLLALASGGTLAGLILAILLLDFSPIGRVFFAAIAILDTKLVIDELRREVKEE